MILNTHKAFVLRCQMPKTQKNIASMSNKICVTPLFRDVIKMRSYVQAKNGKNESIFFCFITIKCVEFHSAID